MLKTSLKRTKKISNKNTRNDHVKQSKCLHAHFFLPSQKITFRSGFVHTYIYIPKYIRTHIETSCAIRQWFACPLLLGNVYQHFERFSRKIVYKNRKEEERRRVVEIACSATQFVGIRARFVIKKKFGCRPII